MNFAAPIALTLLALAVPVIGFYILKVRLRRVAVSTNLFWKQIYDEKPPRSIWQYLRHLLSLLAQLILLTLLVLAVSDPYFSWQMLQSRRLVLVIDNSASMQAGDASPTRFQAAIDEALRLAEGIRFRDEMAVVLSGSTPEVVLGMTGHVPTLKRTLRELEVTDNPTHLNAAIDLAKQLIAGHPYGEVVVLTDGCAESEATPEPGELNSTGEKMSPIRFKYFGTADAGNVGITQFQVRRSLIDPLGYEILASVRNAGNLPVKCRLDLELEGVPVDVLPVSLKPDETWTRSLEKTSLKGGELVARLTDIESAALEEGATGSTTPVVGSTAASMNGLQADDIARAVLPARKVQQVLIVSPGNLFLQKVFEANPLVDVQVRQDFPAEWPAETLIVLHQKVPDSIPPGNVFIVDPANGCELWELGGALENPIVTDLDEKSPLMTHVRLDNVLMPEARKLNFKQPPQVLAGTLSGEAVYARAQRESGKCLVLSVNLDRGDLAFRTAFPIMVTNSLGWFAGTTGELLESLPTGTLTQIQVTGEKRSTSRELELVSPTGKRIPLPMISTAESSTGSTPATGNDSTLQPVSAGPFTTCGLWEIRETSDGGESEPIQKLAVNLSNADESDIRPVEEVLGSIAHEPVVAGWFSRPIWFYLLATVLILMAVEWFLYQRRVIS